MSLTKAPDVQRLIKAVQDLRTKLLLKIQETKKDLPKKLLFLLVGFYAATAFSTFIGQTGDWEVLSASLAVLVLECRESIPLINKSRSVVTMFNCWKSWLPLGLFLRFIQNMKLDTTNILSSYDDSSEWTLLAALQVLAKNMEATTQLKPDNTTELEATTHHCWLINL